MDDHRTHTISFAIPNDFKPAILVWLQQVKTFAISQLNVESNNVQASGQPQTSSNSNLASSANTAFKVHGGEDKDVLEGVTVQYAVQLVSCLGHYDAGIRIQVASFLISLANIFDKGKTLGARTRELEECLLLLRTDDKGFHTPVHMLFHIISGPLAVLALAFVAGLEIFYAYPDPLIRGICITALARLIYENNKVFLEEDHLSAVWNLFFVLNATTTSIKPLPDRVVIIEVRYNFPLFFNSIGSGAACTGFFRAGLEPYGTHHGVAPAASQ